MLAKSSVSHHKIDLRAVRRMVARYNPIAIHPVPSLELDEDSRFEPLARVKVTRRRNRKRQPRIDRIGLTYSARIVAH